MAATLSRFFAKFSKSEKSTSSFKMKGSRQLPENAPGSQKDLKLNQYNLVTKQEKAPPPYSKDASPEYAKNDPLATFTPSKDQGANGFMPSSDKQFSHGVWDEKSGSFTSGKLTDPITGREIKDTPDMNGFQGVEHQKADAPPKYDDLKDVPAQTPNGAWNTPKADTQNPDGTWGSAKTETPPPKTPDLSPGYKSSDDTLKRMASGPINDADVKSLANDIKADPKILEQKNARGNTIIDRVNNNPELTPAQRKEIQASLPADQQGKIEIEQEDYSKTITRSQADIDRDKAINDGLIKSSDY